MPQGIENTADEIKQDLEPLRIGVVGVGARARLALRAENNPLGGEIVAAVETSKQAAQRVEKILGKPVYVGKNISDLLAQKVDAAFVTSPDHTHAQVTMEILEAGVPVYLEKPLAIWADDATAILETAYRTGTRIYVGHNMRHMAVVKAIKQVVEQGMIGEVKAIWCRHFVGHGGDYYFKDWHAEQEKTNSLLLQKGAHDIDVMHFIAGSAARKVVGMGNLSIYNQVASREDRSEQLLGNWFSYDNWPPLAQQGLNPVIDVEDLSMLLMELENGVLCSYQQCHYTPDYWRNYTVIGTQGRAENFGDSEGGVIRVWNQGRLDYRANGDVEIPIVGDAHGHDDADQLTVDEFLRFVRFGNPTQTSPLGAWEAVMAGIAGAESIRAGSRPVEIKPLDPQIVAYFASNQQR